jgi:light-regulated signal transduction histidine kinase (bacteriophytochrome)
MSTDETGLEIQRFWDSAVHDLRAALRQMGMSTELLTKQTAETAQPVLGQLASGVAKMDSILSGVATESNECSTGQVRRPKALPCAGTHV